MGILSYLVRNVSLYPNPFPVDTFNVPRDYYLPDYISLLTGSTTYNNINLEPIVFPGTLLVPVQKVAYTEQTSFTLGDICDYFEYPLQGTFAGTLIDPPNERYSIYGLVKYQLTTEQFDKIQLSLEKANFYNDPWRSLPSLKFRREPQSFMLFDMPGMLDSNINLTSRAFVQSEKSIYLVHKFYGDVTDPDTSVKTYFSLIYYLKRDNIINISEDNEYVRKSLEPYRNGTILKSIPNKVFPKDYIPNYDQSVLYPNSPLVSNSLTTTLQIDNRIIIVPASNIKCGKKPFKKILIQLSAGLSIKFKVEQWMEGEFLSLPILPEEYSYIEEGEKSKYYNTFSKYRLSTRVGRVGFSINSTDLNTDNLRSVLSYLASISVSTGYDKHVPITILDYCRLEPEDIYKGEDYTIREGLITMGSMSGTIGFGKEAYNQGLQFTFMETKLRLLT